MKQRLAERFADKRVQDEIRTVAEFAAIYCRAHHGDRQRAPLESDAGSFGAYRGRPPVLCEECAEHIRYAERRAAHCRQDPKPFCQHCNVHCYSPVEAQWQREMMRFSGPRSVWHGYALKGLKHAIATAKWRARNKKRGNPNVR